MRRLLTSIRFSTVFCCMLVLAVLIAPQVVPAEAHLTRQRFGSMLRIIAALPLPDG